MGPDDEREAQTKCACIFFRAYPKRRSPIWSPCDPYRTCTPNVLFQEAKVSYGYSRNHLENSTIYFTLLQGLEGG